MRFTIRDLLWLMAVVAMALAWAIEHFSKAERPQRYAALKRVMECEGWTVTETKDGSGIVWQKGKKQYGFDLLGNNYRVTEFVGTFDSEGNRIASPADDAR